MNTDNKPQFKTVLGIDERLPPVENSSYKLINWTVDQRSRGWDNRIGYESLIPRIENKTTWLGFQNGGPVNSVYSWNTHQGAKTHLLYEQAYAGALTKAFPTDANANISLCEWKGNIADKIVHDNQRSVPAKDEIYTHYNPIGKNLVVLSGNGRPLRFDGVSLRPLGFLEIPSPPKCWGIALTPLAANSFSDVTLIPIIDYVVDFKQSYGLGTTTASTGADDTVKYRWKVSFLMDDGSESPLSSASIPVTWLTPASTTYGQRQCVYFEDMPLGPEGCVARLIYRTKNLSDGNTIAETFYYCDVIANNFETNYVDYTKDTKLGAQAPDDDASILFPAPGARFSATFKNCLFTDGGQADPQRIFNSQPLKPNQYRSLDFFDVGNRIGGDVTGFMPYYNNLIVFRETAIDIIQGDAVNGFEITPLSSGIGTRGLHTAAIVPEAGVIFMSHDGIYLISGGFVGGSKMSVDKISDPILDTVKRLSPSMIGKACGAYSPKWREYHVYFAADGSDRNTLGVVFHMDKKSWSVREGFPVGCITVDSRGEFIFGHNIGQVVPTPVFPILAGMVPTESGLFFISRARNAGHSVTLNTPPQAPAYYTITENGPPTSTWISANHTFGFASIKKHVKNVFLNCYTEGSNTYSVFYNRDYSQAYTTSNIGLAQRPEFPEQYIYSATTNELVYGPTAVTADTVPTWEIPYYTQLKFPIAQGAASVFSVGIQTTQDFILIDYSLEFNASNTETKAARSTSAY